MGSAQTKHHQTMGNHTAAHVNYIFYLVNVDSAPIIYKHSIRSCGTTKISKTISMLKGGQIRKVCVEEGTYFWETV